MYSLIQGDNLKELLTGGSLNLLARIIVVAIGLLSYLLVAKFYGAHVVGVLAVLTTILSVGEMIAVSGQSAYLLRVLPSLDQAAVKVEEKVVVCISVIIVIANSSFFTCLFLILVWLGVANSVEVSGLDKWLYLVPPFVAMLALMGVFTSVLRVHRRYVLHAVLQVLRPLFNLVLILLLSILFYSEEVPVFSYFFALFGVFFLTAVLFFKFVPFRQVIAFSKVGMQKVVEQFKESYLLTVSALVMVIIGQIDVVMLGFLANLEEAGVYNIAVKISGLLGFVSASLVFVIAPKIAECFYKAKHHELRMMVRQSCNVMLVILIPMLLILVFFGERILLIFGEEFQRGYAAMVLLALGYVFGGVFGPVAHALNLTGKHRVFNGIIVSALLVNVILNYFFIPLFGMSGAAIANVASFLLWNIASSFVIRSHFGYFFVPGRPK